MMRSLWTSATGMNAQMLQIDVISNNLSNVNTTGYKRERIEFATLVYATLLRANLDPATMTGRSVNLQVGHGARTAAVTRNFNQGMLQRTDLDFDFAISGRGFFEIARGDDLLMYTRDGSFKVMPSGDGNLILTTFDGFHVMDTNGDSILIPVDIDLDTLTITEDGTFVFLNDDGIPEDLGHQLRIVQFPNAQGLEAIGSNLFIETVASGERLFEIDGDVARESVVLQGFLEMSNVAVAEEMISLITAQRAFDVASRGITTSDEMLQTAMQLRR